MDHEQTAFIDIVFSFWEPVLDLLKMSAALQYLRLLDGPLVWKVPKLWDLSFAISVTLVYLKHLA